MFSIIKKISRPLECIENACFPRSKKTKLETAVSSYLLHHNFQKKGSEQDLRNYLISSENQLKNAHLSLIYRVCCKTARFVKKIFSKNTLYFDKLLKLDELAVLLRKKNIEILNYKTTTSSFLDLSSFQNTSYISETIKIGLLELEKFQINLWSSPLLDRTTC